MTNKTGLHLSTRYQCGAVRGSAAGDGLARIAGERMRDRSHPRSPVVCRSKHQYSGARFYVTDQNTAVGYRGAVTGGGSIREAVLCSNSSWIQD
jgi:hypothetical protein